MNSQCKTANISTSPEDVSDQSILFCGDFCPIDRASKILLGKNAFSLLGDFQAISDKAGVSIANLEAPFKAKDSKPIPKTGPNISLSPETGEGIGSLGFSAMGLANNHILDFGEKSLLKTTKILKQQGIQPFGAGDSLLSASQPFIFVLADKSYAVIGAADREFSPAGKDTAGAFCPTDGKLALHIVDLHKRYDHVILYYHAGNEYNRYPSPDLVARCHLFVQAGASAVICHHSHVPGAVEFYKDAPIVYSLGNFVFDRGLKRPEDWYLGYAAALTLTKEDKFDLVIVPYKQFNSSPSVSLLSDAESEDLSRFLNYQRTIIANPDLLESEWAIWCNKNRQDYIGRLLGMNRISKKLYKILKYPLLRLSFQKKLYLYNLINCSAHREVLLTLLSPKD